MLQFTKMNGAGNDFVLIDNRRGENSLDQATIAHLCDRHRGVGADGLLAVEAAEQGADFRMRYYNADGGEAEMCGNGARCFARYSARLSGKTDQISFETLAGVITAELQGELVRLAMSPPKDARPVCPLLVADRTLDVHFVNTGVPHAVAFVEDLKGLPVQRLGAALRYHEAFAPKGTNANFAQQVDTNTIAIRTYERGVEGETLACGTGVVASALVFHQITGASSPINVQVRGGDTLIVSFQKIKDGFEQVTLTGPADFVFEGEIDVLRRSGS